MIWIHTLIIVIEPLSGNRIQWSVTGANNNQFNIFWDN